MILRQAFTNVTLSPIERRYSPLVLKRDSFSRMTIYDARYDSYLRSPSHTTPTLATQPHGLSALTLPYHLLMTLGH
jgi:hypothetical protein